MVKDKRRKWSEDKVKKEFIKRVKEGLGVKYIDIERSDVSLKNAIYKYCGRINKLKDQLQDEGILDNKGNYLGDNEEGIEKDAEVSKEQVEEKDLNNDKVTLRITRGDKLRNLELDGSLENIKLIIE